MWKSRNSVDDPSFKKFIMQFGTKRIAKVESKTMTVFLPDDEHDWRHCRLPGEIILQRHNTDVQEDCNTCSCVNGTRTCTKVVCGAHNCWNHTQAGGCPTGEVCVPKKAVDCLSPPCGRWAECEGGATNSKQSDSGIGDEVCLPNSTDLNGDCAKIHIVFRRGKLPKVSRMHLGKFTVKAYLCYPVAIIIIIIRYVFPSTMSDFILK